MSASVPRLAEAALAELGAVVRAVDPEDADALAEAVMRAERVIVHGSGRSLLMLKAIAMRLMHIGVDARVVGEVSTPAIAEGDLLVTASARGGAGSVHALATARAAGARCAIITAAPDTLPRTADDVLLVLPARTVVPTGQHAGSLFEQSLLVVGDALCRRVQAELGVPTSALDARHANL